MTLVLIVLGYITALELTIWLNHVWTHRRVLATLLVLGLGGATGALLAVELNVAIVVFAVFSLFRVINLLRIAESRMQADFLYHVTRKTSLWLIFYQLVTLGIYRLVEANHIDMLTCFYIVAVSQLAGAMVVLSSTLRHIKTTKPPFLEANLASKDLPSITVAIPARNETRDLEECLHSLVQSNYPKLEILVLDDNSQDRRTPEIIRGFAQQGVRFLAGEEPPRGWLAKNYAYQQLAQEANGKILLFCGVDARFSPDTLSTLITNMLHKNKDMASIMPQNTNSSLGSLLVQPARYAWELSLPRRILGRPPVLSTCWLITKERLKAAGGFKAISRKAVPESYFAHFAAMHGDSYTFMHSDAAIGLTSSKTFREQLSTATRTRYPQLHRRPELAVITMMAEFMTLLWPLLIGVLSLFSHEWPLAAISLVGFLMVAVAHASIINLAYGKFMPTGLIILPAAVLYDLFILGHSMWQYEFSEVLWKGRNISQPVMRAIPSLPQLK